MNHGSIPAAAVAALLLLAALVAVLPAEAHAQERSERRGVLFVHGGFGSGGQFESQTLRFASNGYPIDLIRAVDYDSVAAGQDPRTAFPDIDQAIARLKTDTGRDQVDVLGHSLGTTVMQAYLRSSTERAKNVANYVNIDGRQSDDQPGGVRTLALWAEIPIRTNDRQRSKRIGGGAENVYLPDQTHVQAATSEEAFAAMFRFFTGVAPQTTEIVPTPGQVSVAGRALVFPQNVAVSGLRVNFWPIDPNTGARTTAQPETSTPVSGTEGDFGPVKVTAGRQYEMELMRPNAQTIHYYFEPFLRSDNKVRLLYSEAIEAAIQPRGENVGGAVLLRYNEFRGDQKTSNDVLEVNGLNVCTPVLCPTAGNVIGVFVYDFNGDGRSDLSRPNPLFDPLPFLTGADVFVPATRAPSGTTRVRLTPRGGGAPRTLAFPDFPSTTDQAFVYFNDFDQPTDLAAYKNQGTSTPGGGATAPGRTCTPAAGLKSASVRPRGRRGATLAFRRRLARPVDVDVFQTSIGRRVIGERLVARFDDRSRSISWNGRANRPGRQVRDGSLFVRYRMRLPGGGLDVRRVVLRRDGGRLTVRPTHHRSDGCGIVRSAKLERPVFGGRTNRALGIAVRLNRAARVQVTILRGTRVVRRYAARSLPAARTLRLRFDSEGRPRGDYRVRVEAGGELVTLLARRL